MWHDAKENASEPRTVLVVSHYILFGRTVITFQTPLVTNGPRASSVQVDCPIAGWAFA